MTFFAVAERQNKQKSNELGPGCYKIDKQKQSRSSYAPFGSLTSKKRQKTNEGLGPGEYNISQQFVKPSVTRYENKNIIIVKINDEGSHQFKSRTNRFSKCDESFVGPGSYEFQESKKQRSYSNNIRRSTIADKIKEINKNYYEQHKQPTLTSDPLHQHPKSEADLDTKKGGLDWSLNKRQRFSPLIKEKYTQQDKQKALSEINLSKKQTKIRPSAVFASKSLKSHLQTQIYKTNNYFKVELRKMIDYKDEQPGPGTYSVQPNKRAHKSVQNKFQFFGSTVERFSASTEKPDNKIGPGAYTIKQSRYNFHRQIRDAQNQSKEQRYSYLPKDMSLPGPGAYQLQSSSTKKIQKKQQPSFGSKIPRFYSPEQKKEAVKEQNPLLWQKSQKRQTEFKLKKIWIQSLPSAVFASSCQRFEQTKVDKFQQADYNISNDDIAVRLQKQNKIRKQLEDCQLYKPPFMTSEQRFKQHKQMKNDHKDCWCMVKIVEKQAILHQSAAFASTQQRTRVFATNNNVPPVGLYESESRGMIKDSFNSKFRRKNQVQSKRNNVMLKTNKQKRKMELNTQLIRVQK